MSSWFQVVGIPLVALSASVCGWVVFRCLRSVSDVPVFPIRRALVSLAVVAVFYALGVVLVMIPDAFYVGELLVLFGGALLPVSWAWLGRRAILEVEGTTARSRRAFGLGVAAALIVIVYFLVSRPLPSVGEWGWTVGAGRHWLFFVLMVLGAWAMSYFERAFRWSAGRLRKKMRWPRLWLTLLFVIWVLATGEGFFWGRIHGFWLPLLALAQAGSVLMIYRFFRVRAEEGLPLSFSRRAAYTSAIAVILGVYLIFLGAVGKFIQWVGGDLEAYLSVLGGFLALLLLSLLIAMPTVGRRVRRFVDRHLYKSRIDFAAEWAKITENISGILDLPSLVKTVAGFLHEAFTEEVYVFLPVPEGGQFGIYYPFGHSFGKTLPLDSEATDWLWRLGEPVILANWSAQIGNAEEKQFITQLETKLSGRIAVPLLARRRFLGFAVLGDRRDRPDYDDEDFEFLSAMAGPVAFAVLTGQVSEELLAKREMESFNRLSTFVVHDLKNSVSMLSMLLQNAEKHMSDPAFQKSALKTINDAVGRMQNLIGRFSAGKDQLPAAAKPVDLNSVITDIAAHARLEAHPRITFRFAPGKIPAALGDPTQIRRTLENLMVNAVEAIPEKGSLEVSTGIQDGPAEPWVWVRVRDTGCGMTREFISTRLFKPFESTKKKGLGIGMYQVRQMVEADGGRIQLESTPGEGTTFEVYWRAQHKTESPPPERQP